MSQASINISSAFHKKSQTRVFLLIGISARC